MASTASLTLQFAIWKLKARKPALEVVDPFDTLTEDELPPKSPESLAAEKILNDAELKKIDEFFRGPDVAYTGIDEEFDT